MKDDINDATAADKQFDFLRGSERAAFLLRALYEKYGYRKYRMGKFEEYDFYTGYKDFLPGGQILAFTDLDGKLMALKPDVTMSIVKRTRAAPDRPERLYYNESIYRPARDAREYREISQIGLEYIGAVTAETNIELVGLALKSLARISGRFILDVSHNGYLAGLYESVDLPPDVRRESARLMEQKNTHDLRLLLEAHGVCADMTGRFCALATLCDAGKRAPPDGGGGYASGGQSGFMRSLAEAGRLAVNDKMRAALEELNALYGAFAGDPAVGSLRLDLSSFAGDASYYNGIVMKGYVMESPRAVLSGGRYDPLLRRLGVKELEAIGFAVYLDELDAPLDGLDAPAADVNTDGPPDADTGPRTLRIALPKGRMGDKAYSLFAAAGYGCEGYGGDSRKLVFTDVKSKISFLLVKPSDVAVYVERGAADAGVAGKDTLLETTPDVYELLDLRLGRCRLAVAAPDGYVEDPAAVLRVATKYPNITRGYYARQNREIEVIKLNGSIELAPILGVSDVIVDIVETGSTLRENNLGVREEIAPSSARLIANINAYKFKQPEITLLLDKIKEQIYPEAKNG